jgi:hypothetical protein
MILPQRQGENRVTIFDKILSHSDGQGAEAVKKEIAKKLAAHKGNKKGYDPEIGKCIIIRAMFMTKDPADNMDFTPEQQGLYIKITALIAEAANVGVYLLPSVLCMYLGVTEQEYQTACYDKMDYRQYLFSWWESFCDAINQQNMVMGNVNEEMRKWIDRTRTAGKYVPDAEKATVALTQNIVNFGDGAEVLRMASLRRKQQLIEEE